MTLTNQRQTIKQNTMTLQEHKERVAQEKNTFHPDSPANEYFRRGFISGFDQADPIGFMEFVVLNNYFCNDSDRQNIMWSKTDNAEEITTEQLYLKFIEYKQKKQA